jgi:hypothetical protein
MRSAERINDCSTVPLDDAREARAPTRRDPRSPERADWLSLSVEEPWHHAFLLLLELARGGDDALQHGAQVRQQREHASLAILRLAGLESQPSRFEIQMVLLAGPDFWLDPPAGDGRDLEHRLELCGKIREHRFEFAALEEACRTLFSSSARIGGQ